MTKQEVLAALRRFTPEQEVHWMIGLGAQLTVCARGSYPIQDSPGELRQLMGCNELQHKIYGRIQSIRMGSEWTMESFLDALFHLAGTYQIEGELNWALGKSVAWIQ